MREIYLVRHAETMPDPERPPAFWELTDAGRAVAASLKGMLPELVFSSPESKALQTARQLTHLPVTAIEEFREHRANKAAWISSDDFAMSVERYFADRENQVWGDSHAKTAARFRTGLSQIVSRLDGATRCTVVSHGRIICSFLGNLTGTSGYELWKLLTMPTVIKLAVEDETMRIETISYFH
ncbi:histidine phosphatase family protein [Rhizobium sp. 1399]|uniref:histidine phosphatase family protein n=1 Tax=Rhizobium sp. 1399 TaxID=2817758 RepID=UPI00285F1F82|nr:histidine phosphatase family protein [Rhizobium sp. 1399]MDR6669529.1 broad specificity phosphatase PhoE [Rhizobium sp. 1399]